MSRISTIFNGLYLGMILQLAVGPVCLLVFNTANVRGISNGLLVMLSVVLVDTIFIAASLLGISSIIDKPRIRLILKIISGFVLIWFGLEMVGFHSISNIATTNNNPFLTGFIMTISNPLTIIFWGSVFIKQVFEKEYNTSELRFFALGCILATFLFLSLVAILGGLLGSFLSTNILRILNILVGLILIYFGIKTIFKK